MSADKLTAWIENQADDVISNSTSDTSSDDGWEFGVTNLAILNFTYPFDGTAYLYGGIFDPSVAYGAGSLSGFECPAPSLSMTEVADNQGPHNAGDVITFTGTYIVTQTDVDDL